MVMNKGVWCVCVGGGGYKMCNMGTGLGWC